MRVRHQGVLRVTLSPDDVIDRLWRDVKMRNNVLESMSDIFSNLFSFKPFAGFVRGPSFVIWKNSKFRRSATCDRLAGEVRPTRYGSIIEYEVKPPIVSRWSSGDGNRLVGFIEVLFDDVRI